MSTYLVTGAAGFIGSVLAKKLVEMGHEVYTIDNLSTGFRENIPELVEFIEGNCQDKNIIEELNNVHFDAIFHLAGQRSGEISFDDPVYDLQTNTQSSLLLLDYALRRECKKVIYASTMSVYGEQPDEPIRETNRLIPKSFYAVGKIASEHYLRIYSEYGLHTTALRLFNVYGPGQNMKNLRQGMVSIFLAQAIDNRHIHVKGSSERYRDFVHIDDVVQAFLMANEDRRAGYNCYNVGTGVRHTVGNLIEKILAHLPFDVTVEYSGSTPGDQFGIYADIQKIRNEIGWSCHISFDEGLKRMTEWAIRAKELNHG